MKMEIMNGITLILVVICLILSIYTWNTPAICGFAIALIRVPKD